jgi:hypothetical protein
MTSNGTHSYTWNARNRLSQIDSGNTASFAYDSFGCRTSKTILSTQTGFLYDGANPVQELSGSTPTANVLTGSIDEYFTRTDSSGSRHFLTDPFRSTLVLTDSTGSTQTSYTFALIFATNTIIPQAILPMLPKVAFEVVPEELTQAKKTAEAEEEVPTTGVRLLG